MIGDVAGLNEMAYVRLRTGDLAAMLASREDLWTVARPGWLREMSLFKVAFAPWPCGERCPRQPSMWRFQVSRYRLGMRIPLLIPSVWGRKAPLSNWEASPPPDTEWRALTAMLAGWDGLGSLQHAVALLNPWADRLHTASPGSSSGQWVRPGIAAEALIPTSAGGAAPGLAFPRP